MKENIGSAHLYVTGNTVIDALQTTVKDNYQFEEDLLNNLDYKKSSYCARNDPSS